MQRHPCPLVEGAACVRSGGFGAVNHEADVWLNGEYIGHHESGFTPFSFEVTDAVEESADNLLVVVDTRHDDETIPTGVADWFNFGGIVRSVELLCVPETFVSDDPRVEHRRGSQRDQFDHNLYIATRKGADRNSHRYGLQS